MKISNIAMYWGASKFLLLLICCMCVSCNDDRPPYLGVAEKFANALHEFTENPTSKNQAKVQNLASHYTAQLIMREAWVDRLRIEGPFEYVYVRDSLSADRMRAYVWYSNEAYDPPRRLYMLVLRQSLDGWVVDLPIM